MARSPESILNLYQARKKYYTQFHQGMREIQAIYANEVTIPFLEKEKEEETSVPNLLAQGVDQMAGRVASVVPQIIYTPEHPDNRRSVRKATTAKRTLSGWWQQDRLMLKQKVRARRLLAYAMSPVKVNYNYTLGRPTWQIRHPMETFSSPQMFNDTFTPVDCVFTYKQTIGTLCAMGYEHHVREVLNNRNGDLNRDQHMLCIEYVDPSGACLVLTGYMDPNIRQPVSMRYVNANDISGARAVTLTEYYHPDSKDCMTAIVPTRIALDGPMGQFDNMVGMFYTQARLMALELAAIEKGIFPDTFLESRQNEIADVVDGPYDGRTGKITIVKGGTIKTMNEQPGYMTNQTIDRLERSQRINAGIPADFSGESNTNVRTGRRGDALLSAVVDFPLAEAQDVFAHSLADENKAAINLAKIYDGSAPKSIYVGTGNNARKVTYVAKDVFEHDEHVVSYPATGTDLNALMLGGGQRVGLGTMSKRTLAEMDPMVADAEFEHDRIQTEALEESLLESLRQQAATGAIPPMVLAKIMTLVEQDRLELAEAINKVAEDAAAEQEAAQAEQGPPSAEQMMAPAAQQAMAGPQIPGAPQGVDQLGQLMTSLRKPGMTIVPGKNMPQGGM